jgi:hypothetical protein
MKELGYTNEQGIWSSPPVAVAHLASVADVMRALLVKRADELFCCVEGSPEERELEAIADALEAYEAQRWPLGKVPGGKASGDSYSLLLLQTAPHALWPRREACASADSQVVSAI